MKLSQKTQISLIIKGLLSLILFVSVFPALANTPEGWINQQAAPISPTENALLIEQRGQALREQRDQQAQKRQALLNEAATNSDNASLISTPAREASLISASAEYTQLAAALENDPRRIYQFIRNNFKYAPYYGALKGAFLTLKERSGNDFDQAALLVELLRAAGYTANYQYGSMDIPVTAADNMDMAHWLGAEATSDNAIMRGILGSGGIPAPLVNHTFFRMDRVWVIVDINDTSYALDPAFKPSIKHSNIDLATAMGYDQTALLTAAGGLLGTDSIEDLDNANLNTTLNDLSAQLLTYFQQHTPNAKMQDIIGGLSIIPDESPTLPTGLAFPVTTTLPVWTDIPDAYIHTLRIQHGGIDSTVDIPEIAGKKLSIRYVGDENPSEPPPEATDLGLVTLGQIGSNSIDRTFGPNSNTVNLQMTSTLTGTDANAFKFMSGGGSQIIPANGGTASVKVSLTGVGQSSGRKNAILSVIISHNGTTLNSFQYELTGVVQTTPIAKIYLDDTLLIDEIIPTGNLTDFIIQIDHPYAGDLVEPACFPGQSYADQCATFKLKRTGSYVLVSGFGGDKNSTQIADRQRQLDQMLMQGMNDTDPEVLTETLNIMGQNWLKQTQLNIELLGQLGDRRTIRHHRFGMVGQEGSYYIDVRAQFISTPALTTHAVDGMFQASGLIASAMEHSVLEQLQGADKPAISTIKVFKLNNDNGDKFFLANQANFASIKNQLTGYTSSSSNGTDDISLFQAAVNAGSTLILPKNGQVSLNQWSGHGYIGYRVSGTRRSQLMAIGGGLNGGFNSLPGTASATELSTNNASNFIAAAEKPIIPAVDPVDLGSGAYLNYATDLSLGSGGTRGLSFGRSYNSQQVNLNQAYMAPGWTHSYAITADKHSDLDSALGKRTPQDAAALLVSAHITRDLMQDTQPSLKAWIVGALVAQWATDQILDHAVSIKLGDRVLTYRQQPNGSFTPPPGITTELSQQADGSYQLQERFGNVLAFNADNNIQSLTDIDGHSLTFSYTGTRLDEIKDTYNRRLTLSYLNDRLDRVTDNTGRDTKYGYDSHGDLISYHDAENKQWQYGYDNQHQILTVTDPVNVVIVDNIYDESGKVIQQTAPRDNNTTALYKLHYTGLSAAEEDPLGHRITYYFDFTGRTVRTENALGHSSNVSYDGQGQIIKQTDPKGNESQQQYDGYNNLQFSNNAISQQTEFVYDSQHRLTEIIDALTHHSEIDYDNKHRPIKFRNGETDENNQTIESSVSYYQTGAEKGQIHTQTDARGAITTINYDNFGFTDSTKTGSHPVIDTNYNPIGQLTQLTDQQGASTTFDIYDKRGLLKQSTDPLNQQSHSTYDDAGRIKTQTDRNGDTTALNYSPTSKLKSIRYQDGSQTTFNYDSRDNLKSMVDPSGSTTNNYDNINRLISHTDPHGFQVQYGYDKNGNLETLTYPDNKTVSYSYDVLNRLKTTTIDWLTNTPTTTYHYDAAGRMHQTDQANGTQTNYTHDKANRLKGITHTKNNQTETLADYQYTLDANGNRIKAIVEAPQLPEQLINHSQNFNYNTAKNRLESTNHASFSYDDEGQLASKTNTQTSNVTNYSFDYAHRLTQRGNDHYSYDGMGNRIKATRNGQITKYIYDAAGNLLAEADNNNQIQRYYIYGHGMTGFVEASTNQLYTYHHDGTGHTVAITDQNQNTINRYAYDPYGNIMGQQEAISQPFKYVGQLGVQAEANNLYYMRARYYDASIGRFISEDPIGFQGGLNLYAYVGGNPVTFVDPDGKVLVNATGAVFGALSGGIGAYISSGGNIRETLVGAAVGAGAGVLSPATAIGNAAVGFFSSLAGQAIGAGDYKNLDVGLAAVSAIGGVGSRGLTQYLANSSRSSAAFVITRALGPTRPNVINTFNAITDGFIGASAEIAYQNLK